MRRARIDYRMARRALLRDVRAGLRSPREVCDAHPDLVRAGRSIGEVRDADCPICDADRLRQVLYGFYGKGPTRRSGRALTRAALEAVVERYGEVAVYVVEVCPSCRWHHLLESYWLQRTRAAG